MTEFSVTVRERIARVLGKPEIVCGNSDYVFTFLFDGEWMTYDLKTARFVWRDAADGKIYYADVLFSGDRVQMPAIYNTDEVLVGVYAGDIRTTTPVRIPCCGCITDNAPQHGDPSEELWLQILAALEKIAQGISKPHITLLLTSFADAAPQFGAPECIDAPTPFEEERRLHGNLYLY